MRLSFRKSGEEENFEQWVTNRFGRRLYEIFFKTYTEKVWGMPCTEIGADWAAQRIKNLDLAMVRSATRCSGTSKRPTARSITTLIERFHYPRLGPGPDVGALRGAARRAGHRPHDSARGSTRVFHGRQA